MEKRTRTQLEGKKSERKSFKSMTDREKLEWVKVDSRIIDFCEKKGFTGSDYVIELIYRASQSYEKLFELYEDWEENKLFFLKELMLTKKALNYSNENKDLNREIMSLNNAINIPNSMIKFLDVAIELKIIILKEGINLFDDDLF